MGGERALISVFLPFFFFFLLHLNLTLSSANPMHRNVNHPAKPCKRMIFYMHDILYNGKNKANATSTIVAGPEGSSKTKLASDNFFGDIIVFEDPITHDNNLGSPVIGQARGLYVYNGKTTFSAWFGFTITLNTTMHQGTLSLVGSDPPLTKTRDMSVVGGTGDFFMARGVATISTDSVDDVQIYFRIKVDIKLYECW